MLESLGERALPSAVAAELVEWHAPVVAPDQATTAEITVTAPRTDDPQVGRIDSADSPGDTTTPNANLGDDKKTPPKQEEPKKEDEQKHETKGMKGRKLTDAEKKEFDDFGERAKKQGLTENPNRTGEWGKMVDGKFQRVTRIDVAEPGKPGWRGKTHIHIYDDKGEGGEDHLDPKTPIPGEPKKE
jgi:hypothetical protein